MKNNKIIPRKRLENETENKGKQANRYWYKLQLQ